ncbi:MAG: hypothetical protein LBP35_05750 [Candidatus Ancillula trichonymphae]|jgi:6,7-dimethyl-8-ribityllumazine synthase|nr:hypothetical protein [Candidatus Ancillula trichonymphae]
MPTTGFGIQGGGGNGVILYDDLVTVVQILPGETEEFDVVTNETQELLKGHV